MRAHHHLSKLSEHVGACVKHDNMQEACMVLWSSLLPMRWFVVQ